MTTFVASSKAPSINVFPEHRLNPINRLIYSGFTEHMGRCVYGGIYDPENPNKHLINEDGFRLDVIEAFKDLKIPVFRYPGGNFCATYHWENGVGPKENRPAFPELAWGTVETNQFGTDEFMKWCKAVNAEPYLCLNFGTGTLDEALAWVDYCNGIKDTKYANLRRANGHAEPYKVKYWALGNEMWGHWQVSQLTPEAYAVQAVQWAKAIKLLDPSVTLILCGSEGPTSWDFKVLQHCIQETRKDDFGNFRKPLIDMHSIHLYTASHDYYENVTGPLVAERNIEVVKGLIDIPFYELKLRPEHPRPLVCFDEWNIWMPSRAPGPSGGVEHYTLSDALGFGTWLNIFIRKSEVVGMANLAQSVNVLSPLMTSKEGITKQTTWFVYELFCKYMKGYLIAAQLTCEEYTGSTKQNFCRATMRTPYLDVSACYDEEEGMANLAVVNRHLETNMEVKLGGVSGKVQVFEIFHEDVMATNMGGEQKVGIVEKNVELTDGKYTFPKHSFSMLRWKA